MKKPKLLLGVLGFSFLTQLFLAAPAQADWVVGIGNLTGSCVQFDWRGGTATYSGSGAGVFQVDVNNLFDNKIGGGSQADSWSIWVNGDKVVESNVIEQSQVGMTVAGDWVVTVQGIDVGFWAGWYGTMFCNPTFLPDGVAPVEPSVAPEPPYVPAPQPTGDYRLDEGWGAHVVAPAGQMIDSVTAWYGDPNDGSRGADWSQFYTQQMHGLTEADLNSGNYNGDPLPGVYKVLVATVHFVQIPDYVAPVVEPVVVSSSEVRPEEPPVQEVVPETPVEVIPSPEPTIIPEPVPAPVVEPSAPSEPVIVPSVEVRPEVPPVQEVVVVPEPTPTPVEPVVIPPVEVAPSPEPVIVPVPSVAPSIAPIASPEPTPEPTPVVVPPTVVVDPAPVDVRPSEPPLQEVTPPVEVIPEPTPSETPSAAPSEVSSEASNPEPSQSPAEQITDPAPEETATPSADVHEPSPSPEPEIVVDPIPEPTVAPSVQPTPVTEPSPVQTSEVVEPVRSHVSDVKPEIQQVETLTLPDNPSPSEIRAVIEEANTILDSAEPGSPVYEQALNALAEAAQADDPQVPEELANIPGVGQAAVAVMQAFNALGNLGADISPKVRKQMKQVGSAVIVMGIATTSGVSIRRK